MARALDFLASDDEDAGAFAGAPARGGRGTGGSGSRSHGRRQHDHGNDDGADDDGEDGEDDSAFIAAAQIAQNKKAAAQVVKDSIAKGKGKKGSKAAAGGLTGGGSFQSMGLHPSLVRSLLLRGFANPTPIQRLAIPAILEHPPRDVVGMARTGSGKTLAYTVPLIQHLNGRHSSTFGIKALILCPSRELALQILRVGKDIARGWKGGADAEGTDDPAAAQRSEAIRWALIVGGEGMDEQFALMANNPDIVIATPGRLLHLAVEMNLDFSSVSYVVFDEADRLFEMGFAEQLTELLHRLPVHRQTLLFSATLPKSLVEFARAGLSENPKLVRLDADSKVSAELRMAFFSIKPSEKDAALLILLKDLIGVPFGAQKAPDAALEEALNDESDDDNAGGASGGRGGAKKSKGHGAAAGGGKGRGKGKRTRSANAGAISGADQLRPHQTIIFCATKHHVEYLLLLLSTAGYACSHIYSSLDQAARSLQMARFRRGETSLLIVTDVAARGIDLPVLEHVINYDFPTQPRVFVHRVGRTARAGRKGWAWSMVTNAELAFLLDLQLFLARPLIPSPSASDILSKKGSSGDAAEIEPLDCAGSLILGTLSREALDQHNEYIASGIMNADSSVAVALPALQAVVKRAQGMYERSQGKASQESYRRAKEMIKAATDAAAELAQGKAGSKASKALGLGKTETQAWRLAGTPLEEAGVHDVLRRPHVYGLTPLPRGSGSASSSTATTSAAATDAKMAAARAALLAKVSAFSPAETVFEVGIGKNRAASAGSAAAALENAALMRQRRKTLEKKQARAAAHARKDADSDEGEGEEDDEEEDDDDDDAGADGAGMDLDDGKEVDMADEEDIQDVFGGGASSKAAAASKKRKRAEADVSSDEDDSDGELALPQKGKFRDPRFYLDYQQKDANTERGYSLSAAAGGSFAEQARLATFGLATDEATLGTQTQRVNAQRWDTKKQKFIRGDGTGSDNKKLIRTESGARLPASFRSGRWEEWKREKRIDMPKVGERELERSAGPSSHGSGGGGGGGGSSGGKTFRHTKMQAPKPLDKLAKDYQSKLKQRQRKEAAASDASEGTGAGPSSSSSPAFAKNSGTGPKRGGPSKRGGKRGSGGARGAGGGRGGKARNELRSAADIQKSRALLAKRKEKNARPSKKKARRK